MIQEYEIYHGSVFTKLIHYQKNGVAIKSYSSSNASYVINNSIGAFIKHSKKRLSPWRFSFLKEHQIEIEELKGNCEKVFLILVCGMDGIVTLSYEELKKILDDNHGEIEWISASRNRNQEYTINGSDGGLGRKIGKSDFPKKIFNT